MNRLISRREFADQLDAFVVDVRRRALELYDRGTPAGAALRIAIESSAAAARLAWKQKLGAALAEAALASKKH